MERRGFLKGFLGAIAAAGAVKAKEVPEEPKWKVEEDPEPMLSEVQSRRERLFRSGYTTKQVNALTDARQWWDKHQDEYTVVSDAIIIYSDMLC